MIKGVISLLAVAFGSYELFSQQNNPPEVKIIEPQNNLTVHSNALIPYRVRVSDKEDGESAYGEIAANEVFIEVKYVSDASKVSTTIDPDQPGLVMMKKSNCFSCHAFNGKLIAPSFYEMAKRYTLSSPNIELLSKHIREGSGGAWGTATMPSHGELSPQEAKEIANWILKNGADENLNFYVGTEGAFKTRAPDGIDKKAAMVLSATYSDHGDKTDGQHRLTSKDLIVVFLK